MGYSNRKHISRCGPFLTGNSQTRFRRKRRCGTPTILVPLIGVLSSNVKDSNSNANRNGNSVSRRRGGPDPGTVIHSWSPIEME